jgi:hypothetical protein
MSDESFEHPVHLWTGEGADRVGIGFDCVSDGLCYLTYRRSDSVDQLLLDRKQIEWLITTGLPAVLKSIDLPWDDAHPTDAQIKSWEQEP